jgi:hypothetical protein
MMTILGLKRRSRQPDQANLRRAWGFFRWRLLKSDNSSNIAEFRGACSVAEDVHARTRDDAGAGVQRLTDENARRRHSAIDCISSRTVRTAPTRHVDQPTIRAV